MKNKGPVFIGGMQRSGTSLIRAILGSSDEIAIYQWDLQLFTKYYKRCKEQKPLDIENINKLIHEIFISNKVKLCDVSLNEAEFKKRIDVKNGDISCTDIFREFLILYAEKIGRDRWGLKTPGNEYFATDILDAYENSVFVHLIRDPRDVAVSYKNYGGGTWHYNPFNHIKEWESSYLLAKRNKKRYKDRYLIIKYEDFILNPLENLKDLSKKLGVNYNARHLTGYGHLGWETNNSSFNDFDNEKSVLSTKGIGRYQEQLSKDIVGMYQDKLASYLREMDYAIEDISVSSITRFQTKMKYMIDTVKLKLKSFKRTLAFYLKKSFKIN